MQLAYLSREENAIDLSTMDFKHNTSRFYCYIDNWSSIVYIKKKVQVNWTFNVKHLFHWRKNFFTIFTPTFSRGMRATWKKESVEDGISFSLSKNYVCKGVVNLRQWLLRFGSNVNNQCTFTTMPGATYVKYGSASTQHLPQSHFFFFFNCTDNHKTLPNVDSFCISGKWHKSCQTVFINIQLLYAVDSSDDTGLWVNHSF